MLLASLIKVSGDVPCVVLQFCFDFPNLPELLLQNWVQKCCAFSLDSGFNLPYVLELALQSNGQMKSGFAVKFWLKMVDVIPGLGCGGQLLPYKFVVKCR